MKKIRLNESDLRYMVRKAINEVLAYEGEEEPAHDKYYFRCGWDASYGGSNKLSGEGPVGENYEVFLSAIQEYVTKKMEEFASRKGMSQRAMDAWLKRAQEIHGRYTPKTQRSHEMRVRGDNKARGKNYPEYLRPGGSDYYRYDEYLDDIEHEVENNKRWLERELCITVEMPTGEKDPNNFWVRGGWKDYANSAPKAVTVNIDPENIEEAVQKAWDAFNAYAEKTPEVIGWFLWSWSTFTPTLKPILTPEVGKEIEDESDKIQRFYDSLSYKGD